MHCFRLIVVMLIVGKHLDEISPCAQRSQGDVFFFVQQDMIAMFQGLALGASDGCNITWKSSRPLNLTWDIAVVGAGPAGCAAALAARRAGAGAVLLID